jgi:hypothetical protein
MVAASHPAFLATEHKSVLIKLEWSKLFVAPFTICDCGSLLFDSCIGNCRFVITVATTIDFQWVGSFKYLFAVGTSDVSNF